MIDEAFGCGPDQSTRLQLIAAVEWIAAKGGSGVYLRQIDVPSVDTKFIEGHRGVLAEILDRVLAPGQIDVDQPRSAFAQRYGFLGKPAYARFRLLSLPTVPGEPD